LLQSGTAFSLQSGTIVVAGWDRCYKVRRMLLQSAAIVTKWALTVAQGASRILYFTKTFVLLGDVNKL